MATFIGIDVSKEKLDIYVKSKDNIYYHFCKKNNKADIKKFFKKYEEKEGIYVAFENTGKYTWYLYDYFKDKPSVNVYELNPLDLKRRMGLKRGKNDKIDAEAICEYIELFHSKEKCWVPTDASIERLKVLVNERDKLVKQRAKVRTKNNDLMYLKLIDLDKWMKKIYDKEIKFLGRLINEIDEKIKILIASDQHLKKQELLIKSVPGIGEITAFILLVKTNGFRKLTDPRKLACMAGVVPFDNQSGKFKGKSKVSFYADKNLKSILHMAAISVIQMEDNEMAKYYKRKVAEGKHKMSVINAVRSKIIHRVCAVIKNQKKYEDKLQVS